MRVLVAQRKGADLGGELLRFVQRGSDRACGSGGIRMYGSHTSGLDAGGGRGCRAGLPQTSRAEARLGVDVVPQLVPSSSGVGVAAGGCFAARATVRCAYRSWRTGLRASASPPPATAEKEGRRRRGDGAGSVEVRRCTQLAKLRAGVESGPEPCIRVSAGIQRLARVWLPVYDRSHAVVVVLDRGDQFGNVVVDAAAATRPAGVRPRALGVTRP
jgi:hypothetical protein